MMEIIRRLVFGYKVCHKYDLKFIPNLSSGVVGSYYYSKGKSKGVISVALRSKIFYEIFMHELGHHMDFKARGWQYSDPAKVLEKCHGIYGYNKYGMRYSLVLWSEATASRYAMRLLRSCGKLSPTSYSFLTGRMAMASYVKKVPTHGAHEEALHNKIKLADLDYNLCRYISGK